MKLLITKKIKITFLMLFLLTIGGFIIINSIFPKVNITESEAFLTYGEKGENIYVKLTEEEVSTVTKILNNKRSYIDNPSCGFDKNVSITFGNDIYCIACDKCGIIKLWHKEKYIFISDEDREKINKIFENYGGTFPCI